MFGALKRLFGNSGADPSSRNPSERIHRLTRENARLKAQAVSADLLGRLLAMGAAGGTVFDYFVDKGVRAVSLYGNSPLAARIWEQAYHADVRVEGLYGPKTASFEAHLPRQGQLTFEALGNRSVDGPLVVVGNRRLLPRGGPERYYLRDLVNYSYYKRYLLDRLVALKRDRPGVGVALCNITFVGDVENRSRLERHLADPAKEPMTPEEVFAVAFGQFGHTPEYRAQCMELFEIVRRDGIAFNADRSDRYVNCVNGYRLTTDLPDDPARTVYVYGNSYAYGMGADDANTIASALQRELNAAAGGRSPYAVLNCANGGGANVKDLVLMMDHHRYLDGDVVVCAVRCNPLIMERYGKLLACCDTVPHFQRPHRLGEVFADATHLNAAGYREVGRLLAGTLLSAKLVGAEPPPPVEAAATAGTHGAMPSLSPEELAQLEEYLAGLRAKRLPGDVRKGAIVMNCNPFTLGHRSLIEYAAGQVDHLYVFVVEENRSVFPFDDRIELVRQGVADLPNVTVMPSGQFIISQTTFRAYFLKDQKKDVVIDPSGDVTIFAEKIAPALDISVRFVGEEPLCNVTRQYNATMKRILPAYGIEFRIMPRVESGGEPISASRVRRLLEEKDFDAIGRIVPPTTLAYLKRRAEGALP